jgi:uncharacterized protein
MPHLLRKTDIENSISKILNHNKKSLKQPIDAELKDKISNWLRTWKSRQVKIDKSELLVK